MTVSQAEAEKETLFEVSVERERAYLRIPLRPQKSNRSRLFIIRGDIKSTTGYAKATQALALLLSENFDVMGIDLHPNPLDADGWFPFPIKQDADVADMVLRADTPPIILHYTTPDDFQYFPGAVNIGSFYWETEAVPFRRRWSEIVQVMDHMWAPTSFVANFVRRCGFSGPVNVVTWPHDLQPVVNAPSPELQGISVCYVPTMTNNVIQWTMDPERLRRTGGNVFLAVQSLAPRKGLPILLSEWRDYVVSNPTKDILLLKLRFIHSSRISGSPESQLMAMLEDAGFQKNDPVRIAMISADLSENATLALYRAADAYVTATYGEGFGGPVAEALCCGCLVVAPRHTGLLDLLAPNYPLTVAHSPLRVGLIGISNVYPYSSVWHLPDRGAMQSVISRFSKLTKCEREAMLTAARSHLAAFCSTAAVRSALRSATDNILNAEVAAL